MFACVECLSNIYAHIGEGLKTYAKAREKKSKKEKQSAACCVQSARRASPRSTPKEHNRTYALCFLLSTTQVSSHMPTPLHTQVQT